MSSFINSFINEKVEHVYRQLKYAAKVNLAFKFVLRNLENGTCSYFYAHQNFTIMDKSKLFCLQGDRANLIEKLRKVDIVDHCTRERANSKWKYYNLTNVTFSFFHRYTHGL